MPPTLSLNSVSAAYFEHLFVAKNNTARAAAAKATVLLVDRATMPIVSMSFSQSQLLQQDVILIEMLEHTALLLAMPHLQCVVYIKPERSAIAQLCAELGLPHYSHYRVFFSQAVAKSDLEKIALADAHELVSQVAELFQDFSIVNDNLFSIQAPARGTGPMLHAAAEEARSLLSVLLALHKCPVVCHDSLLALKRLASEVLYEINLNSNNNLFDDLNRHADTPPVLLIVDRRSDPLTPLVTPWTYQLMVHELIGISRNVVSLPESGEQLPLAETQDAFFREAMYLNYGDLTDKFQKHVDEYKRQTKQTSGASLQTQDLAELKRVLTRFPEFKKLSNNILKHLNIISDLDKQISAQNLWAVGELQQTVVCDLDSYLLIRARLMDVLGDAEISTIHKIKLLLLFTAKHPSKTADMDAFLAKLQDPTTSIPAPTISQLLLIKNFNKDFPSGLDLAGGNGPHDDSNNIGQLFNKNRIKIQQLFNSNTNAHASRVPKTDNIYMQYVPKLSDTLTRVAAHPSKVPPSNREDTPDKLDLATLVPDAVAAQYGNVDSLVAKEVIVYFKGGVTYEEARLVHELGALTPEVNYIVGGDRILNSEQWVDQMCEEINGSRNVESSQPDRRAQLREIL